MDFTNKVVLITGAGSRVGKTIAINFAKLSASLSLIDINTDNHTKVAEECENIGNGKVFKAVTDVTDNKKVKDAVNATVQEYGKIDNVVISAGIPCPTFITKSDFLKALDDVINVNLISVIAVTHYSAQALIKSKGCVINIASVLTTMVDKMLIPYTVSKAGVVHFTKSVALELAEKGIKVNSISPRFVSTNITSSILKTREAEDIFYKSKAEGAPLRRLVKVEDVAELATFLASDKASSITGTDFVIDCGVSLQNNNYAITKNILERNKITIQSLAFCKILFLIFRIGNAFCVTYLTNVSNSKSQCYFFGCLEEIIN